MLAPRTEPRPPPAAKRTRHVLGIASVKRRQGLFQGTTVAQGAFSVYRTPALQAAGGWPDRMFGTRRRW